MAENRGEPQNIMSAIHVNNDSPFSIKTNMKSEHYHDYYEIYYFLGEHMTYFLDNRPICLKKHDIILVNRCIYHKTFYCAEGGLERVNISFSLDILDFIGNQYVTESIRKLFSKTKLSLMEDSLTRRMNENIMRLCEAYSVESSLDMLKCRMILCELLLNLLKISDLLEEQPHNIELNATEKKVSEIAAFINSNYGQQITLDSIAQKFYISRFYICRIFKKVTGLGIIDFLNRKRLMEAALLLRYSKMNLLSISEKAGFNSQGYFIGLFKQQYGCTPSEYRGGVERAMNNQLIPGHMVGYHKMHPRTAGKGINVVAEKEYKSYNNMSEETEL